MIDGETVLGLWLWGEWRRFVPHPELPNLFKFRGLFFTRDGHVIQRERREPDPNDSDEVESASEPEEEPEKKKDTRGSELLFPLPTKKSRRKFI